MTLVQTVSNMYQIPFLYIYGFAKSIFRQMMIYIIVHETLFCFDFEK